MPKLFVWVSLIFISPAWALAHSTTNAFWNSGCRNTPWGPVKVGFSATAYSSSLPTGPCISVSETRTCARRVLSGSFTNTTCTNGCAAGTTSNCDYTANSSGQSSGTCASGYSGACSYSCTSGARSLVSNTCAASCAGTLVGGYCWYYGTSGGSCTTACSTHGGYNSATQTYAGDLGSDANCNAVIIALGKGSANPGAVSSTQGVGCIIYFGMTYGRYSGAATTAAASGSSIQRACACNN